MKAILQKYLLEHGEVFLPGIGRLEKKYHPARYSIADKAFDPPREEILLQPERNGFPAQEMIGQMARRLNLTEEEVFERLQQYGGSLVAGLSAGQEVSWSPLGSFSLNGKHVLFQPGDQGLPVFESLPAERVTRENYYHEMVVGEKETNTREMNEWLNRPREKADRWWIWPLLVSAAAIGLIIWKFVS